jgi:hypothetical protein
MVSNYSLKQNTCRIYRKFQAAGLIRFFIPVFPAFEPISKGQTVSIYGMIRDEIQFTKSLWSGQAVGSVQIRPHPHMLTVGTTNLGGL